MKSIAIIIPCRNESRFINKCINSINEQDYPRELVKIFISDGMSNDGTRDLLDEISSSDARVTILNNDRTTVPHALNLGIQVADSNIIVRMDVHAHYPRNYLTSLVQGIEEHRADNIGVPWDTLPGGSGVQAHAVAASLRSAFGIGLASYRLGVDQPVEVDTVPFGCFRREVFEKIGLFDEELHRNQDDEFNARMKKNGMRIVLLPGPRIRYFARGTILKSAKMMYQYGHFKPLVNRKIGSPATARQFVPPAFVATLSFAAIAGFVTHSVWLVGCAALGAHLAGSLLATALFLLSPNGIRRSAAWLLPLAFLANHLAYGAGYLRGVWDFRILGRKPTVPDSSR